MIWEILFNITILIIHHKLYSNGGGVVTTMGRVVTTTYHCETPPGLSQWGTHCGKPPWGVPQREEGWTYENFTPAS